MKGAVQEAEKMLQAIAKEKEPNHRSRCNLLLYQHSLINHEGNCDEVFRPQKLAKYSNFLIEIPFFHHQSPTTTKYANPIQTLIGKSMPLRCQVRSTVELAVKHQRENPGVVGNFLDGVILSSLMGLYETSKHSSLPVRTAILAVGKKSKGGGKFEGALMERLLRSGGSQILFFCMKEFLIYIVKQIKPLHDQLMETHAWGKFEEIVIKSMDSVRAVLTEMLNFERAEKILQSVSKQQMRRHVSRGVHRNLEKELMHECDRVIKARNASSSSSSSAVAVKPEDVIHHPSDLALMFEFASIRTPQLNMPFSWLVEENIIDASTQEKLERARSIFLEDGSKNAMKSVVSQLDTQTIKHLKDLAQAFFWKRSTHFIRLPKHVTDGQIKALRRMYGVKGNDPLPRDAGTAAVCSCCSSFKAFIVPSVIRSAKSPNSLTQTGYSQVLCCDKHLDIFLCGRKKGHNHRLCNVTPITRVNLIGRMLNWRGKIYGLCAFCGNFFLWDGGKKSWYSNNIFCGACIDERGMALYEELKCNYCEEKVRASTMTIVHTPDDGEKKLCKACGSKPWIMHSDGKLPWGTICQGLQNRWTSTPDWCKVESP